MKPHGTHWNAMESKELESFRCPSRHQWRRIFGRQSNYDDYYFALIFNIWETYYFNIWETYYLAGNITNYSA